MGCSKLTKKGQVTIPIGFRKDLGLKTGDRVLMELDGDRVVLTKVQFDPVESLIGLGKGVFGASVEYQRRLRSQWNER